MCALARGHPLLAFQHNALVGPVMVMFAVISFRTLCRFCTAGFGRVQGGVDEVSERYSTEDKEVGMAEIGAAELMTFQDGMTDQQKMMFMSQYNSEKKDRSTGLILSILLGSIGVDRFYLGDTGMGMLKLLTLGLCGIMTIIDWFSIMGRVDDYNRRKAQEICAALKVGTDTALPVASIE